MRINFIPTSTKYTKHHLNKNIKGYSKGILSFGSYALKATGNGYVSNRQLESIVMYIRKKLKKRYALYIKVFPDTSITAKSVNTRMGKGKGKIQYWVSVIKKNQVLLELGSNIPHNLAMSILNHIKKHSLNIATEVVSIKNENL